MQSTVMATTRHGSKQTCSDCAGKYYDFGKADALCPKCGGRRVADALLSRGRGAATSRRTTARR